MFISALAFLAMSTLQTPLPPLHVQGADLVDPSGKKVVLRGCNLGNWFMIEHWMLDQAQPEGSSVDQYTLEQLLSKRFGEWEKDRLMDLYRSSWITERDFKIIKSFRFNVVRLPLNYRQFEDDSRPFQLRADAWKWTDLAISWAKKYGIYVILDMHGAQGGQSPYDHTGHSDQNKLWTSEEDQKRYVWLWSEVAKKYRDEPGVVAYDTLNEPYGGTLPQIRAIFDKVYPAIRKSDPEKLIWACAHYAGFENFGNPKENGWHNVGIEVHYYPGIFGNGYPTIRTQARHLDYVKTVVGPNAKSLDIPFLAGEFNVLFNSAGGPEMMRRTYDTYEGLGWTSTMWAYKALSASGGIGDANWGMVTNKEPFRRVDFSKAPESDIEALFKSQGTMEYTVFDDLKRYLAPESVALQPLPDFPVRTEAPQGELEGWTLADIGGARRGGLEAKGVNVDLYGGGSDVWGTGDHFSYLYQKVAGDFDFTVTLKDMEDVAGYCKSGLMIRSGLKQDDAAMLLSSFANGDLQFAMRSQSGAEMQGGDTVTTGGFPLQLKLSRHAGSVAAAYRKNGDAGWTTIKEADAKQLPDEILCGVIALSHDDSQLVKVSYSNLRLVTGKER